jgi:soluble lytic murein transglycosylase
VDSAVGRIATLKDLGMDTEAGFEYTRLFRDASSSQPRLLATAHALSGTEESERSIALGRKALDQLGRSPANLRLYFPIVEREALIQSAKENSLDPVLVAALIRQESEFNPKATSGAGARGLMQLMPSVGRGLAAAKGIGPWDPALLYQPAINIRLGTVHLAGLLHEYPNVERVLAAYNAGESRVAKWATKAAANDPEIFTERIPFVETRDYVRAVMRNEEFYRLLYRW